jgi:hypothetical protein
MEPKMGTWTFSDEEMTATTQERLAHRRNAIDTPYPVAKMLLENMEEVEGGERVMVPWNYQRHSNTTRIVNGFEGVDLTARPTLTHAHDDWCYVVAPVLWSLYDERINRGANRKLDKIAKRSEDTDIRMHRELELQVWQANQTAWSDLNTVNGFDDANGFLEEGAVTAQTNVVMNLSKATYSANPGFQNQIGDIAGAFSTNGLNQLREAGIDVKWLNQDEQTKPYCYASKAGAVNYGRAVQTSDLYSRDFRDAVILDVVINGMAHQLCDYLPSAGTTTGTSDQEWSFACLDAAAIRLLGQKGTVFNVHEWRPLGGAQMLVKASLHEFMGQLIIDYFGSSCVVYGGDTW